MADAKFPKLINFTTDTLAIVQDTAEQMFDGNFTAALFHIIQDWYDQGNFLVNPSPTPQQEAE